VAPDVARRRYIVQGRVQGVGFRWFVLQEGQRLGLAGLARNLRDGSVEVVAEGSVERLTELEQALRQGPRSAHVDRVEITDASHEIELSKPFQIN